MSNLSYATDLHTKSGFLPSRQAIKRAALGLSLVLAVASAADFGYSYLTTGRYLESTDDAYVKADSTIVSPKVSGYLAEVLVGDNEPVKAGQLLARIDDRDFKTAFDQAHADVGASDCGFQSGARSTSASNCSRVPPAAIQSRISPLMGSPGRSSVRMRLATPRSDVPATSA